MTQAAGWLPVDAARFAYTVCGATSGCSPRGAPPSSPWRRSCDELIPHTAGCYAGAEPWSSIYGSPLRLAPDARRFDVSPAWRCWVAAAPVLELLTEVGTPPCTPTPSAWPSGSAPPSA